MMELSTIIPSTTIRAASVTVFSGMPTVYMMAIDMNMLIGIEVAATTADLKGNRIIITAITIIMAMNRSRTNEVTDSSTTLGWSAMRLMETLLGSSFSNDLSTSSTCWPYSTMLKPSRISIDRMMHLFPFWVM